MNSFSPPWAEKTTKTIKARRAGGANFGKTCSPAAGATMQKKQSPASPGYEGTKSYSLPGACKKDSSRRRCTFRSSFSPSLEKSHEDGIFGVRFRHFGRAPTARQPHRAPEAAAGARRRRRGGRSPGAQIPQQPLLAPRSTVAPKENPCVQKEVRHESQLVKAFLSLKSTNTRLITPGWGARESPQRGGRR